MKKICASLLMTLLMASRPEAWAESFFQAEVGLGAVHAKDMGDDVWVQKKGVPNNERLNSPAFIAGLTGVVYRRGPVDLRYHLDYTYFGQQRASCMCVSDADYYAGRYNAQRASFNGFGHTQGVSLTFEPGYTWRGFRLSVEAGPWVNWTSWHETVVGQGFAISANHKATPQFGWVMGAGVERGNFGLHYRYYQVREAWNPNPGLVSGAHMLYLTYRF